MRKDSHCADPALRATSRREDLSRGNPLDQQNASEEPGADPVCSCITMSGSLVGGSDQRPYSPIHKMGLPGSLSYGLEELMDQNVSVLGSRPFDLVSLIW